MMPHQIDSTARFLRVLVLLSIAFLCLCKEARSQQLRIEQGTLDLREKNLQGRSLYLEGDVHFFWNKLLNETSADSPQLIDFPAIWNGEQVDGQLLDANGYATYSFSLILPSEAIGKEYGLYVQDMYSAYRLFLNGREVAVNGEVGKSRDEYTPYWLPRLVVFEADSDTLQFHLQIANFDHAKGGISEAILFGDADTVKKVYKSDLAYDYILSGSLFMGGLFFLGLFFFGRDKRSILYFSLFCLFFSYRILGSVDYGLHHMFPAIPWALSIRIEYLNLFAIAFFFIQYTRYLYPQEVYRWADRFFALAALLLIAVTAVVPIRIFTLFPTVFFGLYLLFVPYCFRVYVVAIRKKRQGACFALLSLMVMFASYGLEAMDYFQVGYRQNLLFFISMSTFFFLQSLILSYRFAMSYKYALSRAQEASQAKSDFLSVMSHEIRTPLNAVVGMSHLLDVKGAQQENVGTLKLAAQNLLLLVNNILDYTKIESGKIEFEKLDTDLPELVEKLRMVHLPKAKEEGIDLVLNFSDSIPQYIICDPTRLTQILSNLLSNGLKFTHEGYVELRLNLVELDQTEARIRFSVSDSGIGIPEDKREMIFDSFTQATRSVTRNYGGTGLGLPIIQKLLELQQSELHLESEEGRGSKFWFELSFELGKGKKKISEKPVKFEEWDLLRGKRILLVEDNAVNVVIARKFLERWQIKVEVAMSGEEALKKSMDFDLILMDLQMPDIDGYTLTKMLRTRGVRMPILAFTASALFDARQKILSSGMDDFVMKPFDPEELYKKLVKQLT